MGVPEDGTGWRPGLPRQGVTRLVVALAATDVDEQHRDLEAFAKPYGLM
jgi:hypothetical protein